MSQSSCVRSEREAFAASQGASINANNGIYVNGQSYGLAKKLEVAAVLKGEERRAYPQSPSINAIAQKCQCSWSFVEKIRLELLHHGRVIPPSEIIKNRDGPRGAGSKSLNEFDRFVLLQLYLEEPSRSLSNYVHWLHEYTGTVVSRSTISRFFLTSFEYRAGFVKCNLYPQDKFRPTNHAKAYEYIYMLSHIAPERVKFGDEKSLKGQELYNRDVRRNPITNEVPAIVTDSNFRNTHSITGFCGIDRRTNPIWYRIHRGTNDSEQFKSDIEAAIIDGFLRCRDVLVLDNVAYHSGKCNKILERWLWKRFAIFVIWLPTRSPEWNPIELAWNYLVQKLGTYPLCVLREEMRSRGISTDVVAYVAKDILDGISHDLIAKFYRHCFKGVLIDE